MPPPMPPPGGWERAAASGDQAGRGKLILQGAARGWMIFAIVWGSILFVIQGTTQNAAFSNNNNPNMYIPAPAPHHDPFI
jgi:hypothetical protein